MPKRLAIIGCGSSGLITLKYALDELRDWEITAYEASSNITGCWGNPPTGFVSTSTKYTTQFACYPLYDANVRRDLLTDSPSSATGNTENTSRNLLAILASRSPSV
jgi:cation diffusion facilitator CzcD-associated flavoprotein CzcO